ncbi:hypothetical protein K469DRAFT_691362 [Zopfia rhizophila CBS 207.26]|uniref:Gfo/Idh/MocA-like oxidoreductase N-terminal domain-containing protein n=1 Tax=Zopfia rhizophila CBS 207.26 TaxID=1314779 RepID=A0A6A6DSS8_9PEZI|nr:hypothetical protein K469DRAFT_691362 [Zopfia rhizophila CBS 207.26]
MARDGLKSNRTSSPKYPPIDLLPSPSPLIQNASPPAPKLQETSIPTSNPHTKSQRAKKPAEAGPRILIIGAGYRGHAYAGPIRASGEGTIAAVVEASAFKQKAPGVAYIRGAAWREGPWEGEEFHSWKDYVGYETDRRERVCAGEAIADSGIDAVFVCMLGGLLAPVVKSVASLGLHVMCEKPLATRLDHVLG